MLHDMQQADNQSSGSSRREFLGKAAIAGLGVATMMGASPMVHASGSDVLKIGLVGCGGRGTGAADDALGADPNVKLVAMGDIFEDQIEQAHNILSKNEDIKARIDVPKENRFSGWDAYKKVIDSGVDVVLLCTSPHFRPLHLEYAIKANKHIFCEKPVAVDATGVRKVIELSKQAKKQNIMLMSGLCYRYEEPKMELMKRIHDGQIGNVKAIHTCYQVNGLWHRGHKKNWSDMEFQMRNWLYFTWLSGDHIVEQHIHSIDKGRWALNDQRPISCMSSGGRQTRTDQDYGNVYDHFSTVYDFEDGVKVFSTCRQMNGCDIDVNDYVLGTKGNANCMQHKITGEAPWAFGKKRHKIMYQAEHVEFYKSLRAGKIINNGDYMCDSTMMAIMGRMSAYSGKKLKWEEALNSEESLVPEKYEWGTVSIPATVAMPGIS